ncbi:chitinase [Leuconostoc falkenbergense]|uniref:chitinase n=1 Tax=Leuconostoc falkenbergense TaxID=2766470 RepID=UPI0024A97AFB|nr:chitinase [Leuconostoc falkenbergense]MDI6553500.1 chitinase [Leuconostoc falkenbergense]
MTILTKTITAALVLSIGAAPLVGIASAADLDTATSNGTVSFADESGELSLTNADDINWAEIDLSNITNFSPAATNSATGKLELTQTSANPTGNYLVTVQQTGDWAGGSGISKSNLPIKLGANSLASGAVTAVNETVQPSRGTHAIDFKSSGDYTLDLSGSGDLSGGKGQSLTSEVTWTLTDAQ